MNNSPPSCAGRKISPALEEILDRMSSGVQRQIVSKAIAIDGQNFLERPGRDVHTFNVNPNYRAGVNSHRQAFGVVGCIIGAPPSIHSRLQTPPLSIEIMDPLQTLLHLQ